MGFVRGGKRDFYTYIVSTIFLSSLILNDKSNGFVCIFIVLKKLFFQLFFFENEFSENKFKIFYGKKSTVRGGSECSGILLQHHAIFIVDKYCNIYKIHIVGDTGTSSHEGVTILNIIQVDDYSDYHCHCIGYTNVDIYEELKDKNGMRFRNKSRFNCHDFAWYIVEKYTDKSDLIPVNVLLFGCIRWQHYLILLSTFLVFIQLLDWWLVALFILIFKFYECYLYYDIQCALNHEIYSTKSFIKFLYDITDDEEEQLRNFIVTINYFSLDKDLRGKLINAFFSFLICLSNGRRIYLNIKKYLNIK